MVVYTRKNQTFRYFGQFYFRPEDLAYLYLGLIPF